MFKKVNLHQQRKLGQYSKMSTKFTGFISQSTVFSIFNCYFCYCFNIAIIFLVVTTLLLVSLGAAPKTTKRIWESCFLTFPHIDIISSFQTKCSIYSLRKRNNIHFKNHFFHSSFQWSVWNHCGTGH